MHMGLGGKRQKKTLLFILFQMAPPPGVGGKTQNYGANIKNTPPQYKSLF